MPELHTDADYADRDAAIAINNCTTVLRGPRTPHDLFATYWRDVHGPLCARIPGLGWYVQNHFDRDQDAHLRPIIDGIAPFPDYELDGGVEIGFHSTQDPALFNAACPIVFTDEQNAFAPSLVRAMPSRTTSLMHRRLRSAASTRTFVVRS